MTNKLQVQKYKARSSPAARQKAQAELDVCKRREQEIKAATIDWRRCSHAVVKAGRFVVDVNGDPPSIDQLRSAVEEAERQIALSEESADLRKKMESLRGEAGYYQFVAGHMRGSVGFSYFVVSGQGDTKKEALENARKRE